MQKLNLLPCGKKAAVAPPSPADPAVWFTNGNNNVTSCAYNPATDKLYVGDRNTDIHIVNPATGLESWQIV